MPWLGRFAHIERRRAATIGLRVVCGIGAFALASIWIGWSTHPAREKSETYAVHVFAVGNGSAALVVSPRSQAVLVDVGTISNFDAGETVIRAARQLGVRRLNQLTISHANFDHFSGTRTVLANLGADRVLLNPYFGNQLSVSGEPHRLVETLEQHDLAPAVVQAGDTIELEHAKLVVLWPPGDLDENWRANDRSLVLRLEIHGRRVLFAGDIENDALRELLDMHEAGKIDLHADVLIAPHHGSVVSQTGAFYTVVAPEVVVVSTGRPRPALEQLIGETLPRNCRLLMTSDLGQVVVRIHPDGDIEVRTPHAQ